MRDAAQRLGVSMTTLEKWCKRLGIAPARHPQDWRFRTLTPEQLQQIADDRALMPTQTPAPYKRLDAPVRPPRPNLGEQPGGSDRFIVSARQKRLTSASAGGLPEGWMSRTEAADRHGIKRSTLIRWCALGKIETAHESYGGEHGTFRIEQPVTRKGLAQLFTLASLRSDFVSCEGCPHVDA